jgi:parvulin-like peptidyl-prolyl isomerase
MQTLSRSTRLILFRVALILPLCLASCGLIPSPSPTATPTLTPTPVPPTATPEPMAATINGEGIPLAEFNAELERYLNYQAAQGKTVAAQDAAKVVMEDMIDQVLFAQGAHAAGYTLDDAGLQARVDALAARTGGADKLAAWVAAQGYTEPAFRASLKRAAEAAWMRDKIISAIPMTAEQVHVQQILLYNESKAQDVLAQLKAGSKFPDLATRYDPITNGELGWLPRGYLLDANAEAAVFALEAGQYSEIIHTDAGYHIFMVLERDPQRALSPDAYLVLQEHALTAWLDQQRQSSTIILEP